MQTQVDNLLVPRRESADPPEHAPVLIEQTRDVRGLELTMAQLGVSDLIVGKIRGHVPLSALRQAAFRMQWRHPGLRARLVRAVDERTRPIFEFCEPDVRRVVVEEVRSPDGMPDSDRPLWERVVEREVDRGFDLERGYMFRVLWVPDAGEETGHLVLVAQHALVDGVSLMRLLNDILVETQRAALDPAQRHRDGGALDPLAPTPAVLTQIPVRFYERIATALVRRSIIRAQRLYATYSPFPIEAELPKGEPLRTHCRFRAGDGANYRRVREACRKNGVTVGGAFSAAAQFASLRLIHERTGRLPSDGRRVKFPMTMDFSLRRAIPGVARTAPQLGLFTGASDIAVRVRDDIGFWELARALRTRAEQRFENRAPLLFHQVLDGLWDLTRVLEKEGIDYVSSGGIAESVNISSVGEYPYPARVGSIALEEIFGLNTAMRGGPMFIVWLRTLGDRFFYNATSASPAASRATGDALFGHLFELMETCDSPALNRTTLRDYARSRERSPIQ